MLQWLDVIWYEAMYQPKANARIVCADTRRVLKDARRHIRNLAQTFITFAQQRTDSVGYCRSMPRVICHSTPARENLDAAPAFPLVSMPRAQKALRCCTRRPRFRLTSLIWTPCPILVRHRTRTVLFQVRAYSHHSQTCTRNGIAARSRI